MIPTVGDRFRAVFISIDFSDLPALLTVLIALTGALQGPRGALNQHSGSKSRSLVAQCLSLVTDLLKFDHFSPH
jgi:hypothetical protein